MLPRVDTCIVLSSAIFDRGIVTKSDTASNRRMLKVTYPALKSSDDVALVVVHKGDCQVTASECTTE